MFKYLNTVEESPSKESEADVNIKFLKNSGLESLQSIGIFKSENYNGLLLYCYDGYLKRKIPAGIKRDFAILDSEMELYNSGTSLLASSKNGFNVTYGSLFPSESSVVFEKTKFVAKPPTNGKYIMDLTRVFLLNEPYFTIADNLCSKLPEY